MEKMAIVNVPPLEILPDWQERAVILSTAGIDTAEDLFLSDSVALASQIGQDFAVIRSWKSELLSMLIVPDGKKRCWE
jgi:hypothetical protein